MARPLTCLYGKTVSRYWRSFWPLVEHLLQVERHLGLVSQHCIPLQKYQKVSIHGLILYKWPEHWLAFMEKLFSRCWGDFWSLLEHLSWVKRCPGGFSQHYSTTCHCIGLGKSLFMVWSWKMVRTWTGIHGRTVLPGAEEPCGTC